MEDGSLVLKRWRQQLPFISIIGSSMWVIILLSTLAGFYTIIFNLFYILTQSTDESHLLNMYNQVFSLVRLVLLVLFAIFYVKPHFSERIKMQQFDQLLPRDSQGNLKKFPPMLVIGVLIGALTMSWVPILMIIVAVQIRLFYPPLLSVQSEINSDLKREFPQNPIVLRPYIAIFGRFIFFYLILVLIAFPFQFILYWLRHEYIYSLSLFYFEFQMPIFWLVGITVQLLFLAFYYYPTVFRKIVNKQFNDLKLYSISSGDKKYSPLQIWVIPIALFNILLAMVLVFFMGMIDYYSNTKTEMNNGDFAQSSQDQNSTINEAEVRPLAIWFGGAACLIIIMQSIAMVLWYLGRGIESLYYISVYNIEFDDYMVVDTLASLIMKLIGVFLALWWIKPKYTKAISDSHTRPAFSFKGIFIICVLLLLLDVSSLWVALLLFSATTLYSFDLKEAPRIIGTEEVHDKIFPFTKTFAVSAIPALIIWIISTLIDSLYNFLYFGFISQHSSISLAVQVFFTFNYFYYILFGLLLIFFYFKPKYAPRILNEDWNAVRTNGFRLRRSFLASIIVVTFVLFVLFAGGYTHILLVFMIVAVFWLQLSNSRQEIAK
jgi:hypothetical protein